VGWINLAWKEVSLPLNWREIKKIKKGTERINAV
jgi:hypothetical protein